MRRACSLDVRIGKGGIPGKPIFIRGFITIFNSSFGDKCTCLWEFKREILFVFVMVGIFI